MGARFDGDRPREPVIPKTGDRFGQRRRIQCRFRAAGAGFPPCPVSALRSRIWRKLHCWKGSGFRGGNQNARGWFRPAAAPLGEFARKHLSRGWHRRRGPHKSLEAEADTALQRDPGR